MTHYCDKTPDNELLNVKTPESKIIINSTFINENIIYLCISFMYFINNTVSLCTVHLRVCYAIWIMCKDAEDIADSNYVLQRNVTYNLHYAWGSMDKIKANDA